MIGTHSGGYAALDMTPIEERMYVALLDRLGALPGFVIHSGYCPFREIADDYIARVKGGRSPTILAPQVYWGSYRIDLVLIAHFGEADTVCLAIECDGHDFHERTKEQAARDKSRDRALIRSGLRAVLRFTGSEIWHRADECAGEIVDILRREMNA